MVVLNPMGNPPAIESLQMAPRLDSLDDKTVYLVDMRFDDGDIFLKQMKGWFNEHMPEVNTVLKRKSGVYTQDDDALIGELKEKSDAAVVAIGH